MKLVPGLTLCTVSFGSKVFLDLNRRLADALNGERPWEWLVVENSPAGSPDALDGSDSRFTLLGGVEFERKQRAPASYHHGRALNHALEHVRTRFALVMDPDFYIVRPGWADTVPQHMEDRGLCFFGVPWHPKFYTKYRYFPCAHCMFVDLVRAPRESLDFRPSYEDEQPEAEGWGPLHDACLKIAARALPPRESPAAEAAPPRYRFIA
ncbi:hypothetical protein ACFLSJ_08930 [Verrucomicrobiota bacterium]